MPITVRLLFFLAFTLLFFGVEEDARGQVRAEITGYVKDVTETPLVGGTVYLQGTQNGSITDADGFFLIDRVVPGTYNLVVSFVGFESQTKFNIEVKSVGNQAYNFTLVESIVVGPELLITPDRNLVSRPIETPLSTQTLTAVELATYPGGNNDVVKVAQSLPGISPSPGGFRNDLIIRGGAPNESVYYLDGVEIPNINHFSTQGSSGGPVGLLNVSFIDNVTLSTSAFGAQYDNPLSGVLQFDQREGSRRQFSTNFRISASEAAITANGPLFKGGREESNTSYLVSVRRSYLQYLFEFIGLPIRPDYWDYQYKLSHRINSSNSISLIGVGSIDDFAVKAPDVFDSDQQSTLDQSPFIEQQTNTIGLTWRNRLPGSKGFMTTTVSNNLLNNDFSRFADNATKQGLYFSNDSREMETKLRYSLNYFTNGWEVATGFNTQLSDYTNSTIDLNSGFNYDTDISFVKYGLFANAARSLMKGRLDLSVGIRADGDSFTEGNSLLSTTSPRVGVSFQVLDGWKINGTVGRYYKLPPYTVLGFQSGGVLVNKDADYTRSDHFVLGVERVLGPASNLSLEGFLKLYGNYPVSVADQVSLANKGAGFEVLGNEDVETVGKGRTYGTELLFQQKLTRNFYGIFSYTFFFSEFSGFDPDVFQPSLWDSRHLLSFTGGYKLGRNWELSSRLRFAGESPIVPVNPDLTLAAYPQIVLDYSRLGDEQLATFSRLDVRIDKKWNFARLSLDVFLDLENVLGQTSPAPPQYGLTRDESGVVVNPRSLFIIDPDAGTPIPTIGIVLDF